jgi:hypothetical protein
MASRGDDDQRVKRKHDVPREKQPSRCGRGAAGSSKGATSSSGDVRGKGSRDEHIQQEEALEVAGCVIPPNACPETPPHLDEFDPLYLRDYEENVVEKGANDTRQHPFVDYVGKQKMVEEARLENPYEVAKDLGVDYRFWNVFHSNFYTSVIFNSKSPRL